MNHSGLRRRWAAVTAHVKTGPKEGPGLRWVLSSWKASWRTFGLLVGAPVLVALVGALPAPSPASAATKRLLISPSTLPSGVVRQSYSAALSATGGKAPYTWTISSGALPIGSERGRGSFPFRRRLIHPAHRPLE
jgi:hypothetical protein